MEASLQWFWNEEFWLPANISFKDLENQTGHNNGSAKDLLYMPLYAIALLALRKLFEHALANPLAARIGVVNRDRKPPVPSTQLENLYSASKFPGKREVDAAAKRNDMSVKQVQNWLRRRRNIDRPNVRKKFAEASWRCCFYTFAFAFGLATLYSSDWLWDNMHCWVGYPNQIMWPSVHYYYMLEGGFYLSLLFTVLQDVRRKDFAEQLIHHAATLFLIGFSYTIRFVRVGTLVMALHDISDIVLEGSKCISYSSRRELADKGFVIFAVIFIVSRLFVMPVYLLHTTWVKTALVLGAFPLYYVFNALLLVLQLLHVFWAMIIIRMAVKMHRQGTVEKDARSDEDEESDE